MARRASSVAIAEVDMPPIIGGSYEVLPEHLSPREYGEKLTMPVPLGLLIRLDQVRGDVNPAIGPLRESIAHGDLINQIDVARLSKVTLQEYIEFVNRVWRSKYSIDDYQPDENGAYFLVMAGHSRTEAIAQIEDDKAREAKEQGFDTNPGTALVWAKIIDNPTPEEIIALQLEENIYRMPSEERGAMAIVETFMFGVEKGKWATRADFLRLAGHKFTREVLNRALYFVNLDPVHRDLVFCGAVKYGPSIEVAKSIELYRRYNSMRFFGGLSPDEMSEKERKDFDEDTSQWCGNELASIQKGKWNVTAARKRYEAFRKNWQEYLDGTTGVAPGFESIEPDILAGQQRQDWLRARRNLKANYANLLGQLSREPLHTASKALQLHFQIFKDPVAEAEIRAGLADRILMLAKGGGSLAVEGLIDSEAEPAQAAGMF